MANRMHTVEPKTIAKNASALLAYHNKKAANDDVGKALFQDAEKVILQIDLHQVPHLHNKSYFFDLPKSPIFDKETSEVCCIVKDAKSIDKYEHRNDLRNLFKRACPFVSEVIPLKVLKCDVKTHEQKRILANSYDFFVADRDIFNVLPTHLGSHFIRLKKRPRKINNLSADGDQADGISARIQKVLSQGMWCVDGRGTCTSIIIGTTDFTSDELIANAEAALTAVAQNVPRGWKFIKSVHLKLEKSIALKLYQANNADEIPKDLDSIEQHHDDRVEMKDNTLITMYKSLRRNNKNLKRSAEKKSKRQHKAKSDEKEGISSKKQKVDEKSTVATTAVEVKSS